MNRELPPAVAGIPPRRCQSTVGLDPRLTLLWEQVLGIHPIHLYREQAVPAATWSGGGDRKVGAQDSAVCKSVGWLLLVSLSGRGCHKARGRS